MSILSHKYVPSLNLKNSEIDRSSISYTSEINAIFERLKFLVSICETMSYQNCEIAENSMDIIKTLENTLNKHGVMHGNNNKTLTKIKDPVSLDMDSSTEEMSIVKKKSAAKKETSSKTNDNTSATKKKSAAKKEIINESSNEESLNAESSNDSSSSSSYPPLKKKSSAKKEIINDSSSSSSSPSLKKKSASKINKGGKVPMAYSLFMKTHLDDCKRKCAENNQKYDHKVAFCKVAAMWKLSPQNPKNMGSCAPQTP